MAIPTHQMNSNTVSVTSLPAHTHTYPALNQQVNNQWYPASGGWHTTPNYGTFNAAFPQTEVFYVWATRPDPSTHTYMETFMIDGPFASLAEAHRAVSAKVSEAASDGFLLDVKRIVAPFYTFAECVKFLQDLAVFSDYYASV